MKTLAVCGTTPLGVLGALLLSCGECNTPVWMSPRVQREAKGTPGVVLVRCASCAKQVLGRTDA